MKLAVLVMWGAGTTFMLRLQGHRDWMAAAFGAVVFAGAPYLLLDLNVRAAYPEFVAIMCAVGTLWAIGRLFASPGPARAAWLACLLAAALVCHLPATLIFAPVFAAMGEDCYRAWFEEENFSVPEVPGSGPDGVDAAEGVEGVVATLGV